MTQERDHSDDVEDLIFYAGRFAEARGLPEPQVVHVQDAARQTPGTGDLLIVAPKGGMEVADARDVAALRASGKSIFVITREPLEPEVQAWVPKECVHVVGQAGQPTWRIQRGLLALTHEESPELMIDELIQETGVSVAQAHLLASHMDEVTPRVAWDRPILANDYRCWDYIVNRAGTYLGSRLRGLKDSELIPPHVEAPWAYWERNPLYIHMGGGEVERAIMTINVHLDGHAFLLVCVNDWDVQGHWDRSYCARPDQSRVGDADFAWKQATAGGKPDSLEPAPPWFKSLDAESVDFLYRLMDGLASGFLNGIVAGGVDWLCAQGKGLDEALQADWATAIGVLRDP